MTSSNNISYSDGALRCALERLGDKWTLLVLGRLFDGAAQFGELHRSIGMSKKVLTEYLRRLERDGLISRRVSPGRPATVEYSLTPLGMSTRDPIEALRAWAERHHRAVLGNRDAYDRLKHASRDVA